MIDSYERLTHKQADAQRRHGKYQQLHELGDIYIAVQAADAFAHCVDSIGEGEEQIYLLVHLRQQLYREGAAGACDLENHNDDDYRLADIAKGHGQRIYQQAEGKARDEARQVQKPRLQTLYLQNQQVAGDYYRGLYLAHHEEQQIPAEEQLHGLGVHKSLGACVRLEYRNEDNAADPYRQHRVERSHRGAVVRYRVYRGDAGLHYLREVLAVDRRTAAQQVDKRGEVVLVGRDAVELLQRLRKGCDDARGCGLHRVERIVQRGFCALDGVAQDERVVIQLAHTVKRRRNVEENVLDGLGKLLDGGDDGVRQAEDGINDIRAVADGLLNIVPVRQGIEPLAEVVEVIGYLLRESLCVLPDLSVSGDRVAPAAHLIAAGYRVGGGLLDRFLRRSYRLGIAGLDGVLEPVERCLHLFKRLIHSEVYLRHVVAYLAALRKLGVDVGNYLIQLRGVDADVAAAARREVIQRALRRVQRGQRLLQNDVQRLSGVILSDLGRDDIRLLHDTAYQNFEIVLVYRALERLDRSVGYLGRNGVLLCVFIVGYLRLAVPHSKHVVHVIGEVLVNDDGGVVFAGVHTVDGLLLAVCDDPVDGR